MLMLADVRQQQVRYMYSGAMKLEDGTRPQMGGPHAMYARMQGASFPPGAGGGDQWRQVVMLGPGMRPPGMGCYGYYLRHF